MTDAPAYRIRVSVGDANGHVIRVAVLDPPYTALTTMVNAYVGTVTVEFLVPKPLPCRHDNLDSTIVCLDCGTVSPIL